MQTEIDVKELLNDLYLESRELGSANDIAEAILAKLDTEEKDAILLHLLEKLAVPHMRAAYSKQSEGKVSPKAASFVTLKPVVGPVNLQKTVSLPPRVDHAMLLRFAVVDGKPLVEHTIETLNIAIAKNRAKALGYLAKNDKLERLRTLLEEENVETLGQIAEKAIIVWQQ